jgi:golgi-specific brefeldin A-resistance guanine nucleotide exchange factor 1
MTIRSTLPSRTATPSMQQPYTEHSVVASARSFDDTPPISVARDPVALVVQECITVTGAMRKHARWAKSSVSAILGGASLKPTGVSSRKSLDDEKRTTGVAPLSVNIGGDDDDGQPSRWGLRGKKGMSMVDNPLLAAFARLRGELKGCKGMALLPT